MKFAALRRIYQQIRGGKLTLKRVTGSIFLGLFIGLLPLFGLHLPLCLGLSMWFGLDGLLAYAAANISNPLFAPFIVMLEVEVGSFIFTGDFVSWDLDQVRSLGLATFTAHSLVGAVVVAFAGATLGAALTLATGLLLRARRDRHDVDGARQARRDTVKCYAKLRAADRHYVRIKLLTDPLAQQLADLNLDLGDVTDAGCGRGQFGLYLHHLGYARTIRGFDWDQAKVVCAQQAAGNLGQYFTTDLRDTRFDPSDTVLLFDVMHYLSKSAQTQLLERVFACLRPGGRLLLRDVDKNRGFLSLITRLFERIGTRLSVNRSDQLVFRSSRELRAEILALGFELESSPSTQGGLLDNQLWLFRKPLLHPLGDDRTAIVT